jgi:hypothetical protein
LAVGLGNNCSVPTQGVAPTLCDRGEPCYFVEGPMINIMGVVFSYNLRPVPKLASSGTLLMTASTDPCEYTLADPNDPDNGKGCPIRPDSFQ